MKPFRPIPPGEILKEELEARGWTQADFADITGKPVQALNEIMGGKKAITPETAVLFSDALGTSAEFWLNLESAYRLDLVRRKRNSISPVSRKARIYSLAPIKELLERGWIRRVDKIDELETEILKFLRLPSVDAVPSLAADFRTSDAGALDSPALIAWIRKAQIEAEKISCPTFDRVQLKKALADLRSLSGSPEGIRTVIRRLRDLGVRTVLVSHLPQTRVDGAVFWLGSSSPVIALSLRIDRIDNFWFTLMHEIGHILEGPASRKGYVDSEIDKDPRNEREKRINLFARNQLIPPEKFAGFIKTTRPYFSRSKVINFAADIGVHPAIVVGRLQFEKEIPYTNLRNLLPKVSVLINRWGDNEKER